MRDWQIRAGFGVGSGLITTVILALTDIVPPGPVRMQFAHSAVLLLTVIFVLVAGAIRPTRLVAVGTGLIGFLLLAIAFVLYLGLYESRTFDYLEDRVVIGVELVNIEDDYNKKTEELLDDYAGKTEDIWSDVKDSANRLLWAYMLVVSLSVLSVVFFREAYARRSCPWIEGTGFAHFLKKTRNYSPPRA